ncbi:MAG: polyprenyl synthetase family protein [Phycisphaerae bacterium]
MLARNMTIGSIAPADLYAPVAHYLKDVEHIIEDELFSDHPAVNELCTRVSRYRGKMLRPALLLLCAKACGRVNDAHRTLAAVVETVHLATLVHDDVLDDAAVRRKQPTINATDGNVTAVLLGDYLISHAYHLCSSLDDQYAARTIAATTNTVCEGELMEIHHRYDDRLSEGIYFDIIENKTAALTSTCCLLGVRYAGADEDVVKAMGDFGAAIGRAFQIVDDVLDLVGDESRTGKTLGLDLAHGSATLPIIHCLANAPVDIGGRLRAFVRGEAAFGRQRIVDWLESTGSIEHTFQVAREHVQTALQQLTYLSDSPARDSLAAMTEFILRRQF